MLKRLILSLAVLAILFSSARLMAEVFRFTDDKGVLHYVDNFYSVPEKYRGQLKDAKPLPQISVISPGAPVVRSDTKQYDEPKKKIEVYVTSWCPYCKKLLASLDASGIAYTKYDIEKDSKARAVYQSLGGGGVPLTRVGSTTVHGNNPDAIKRLIR